MKIRVADATGCPVPQFVVEAEDVRDELLLKAFFMVLDSGKWKFSLHGNGGTGARYQHFNFGLIKDISESKPEPINWLASGGGKSANTSDFKPEPKNCGKDCLNCSKHTDCVLDCFPDDDYACWQPKAAEPQTWEQRLFLLLDKVYFHKQTESSCDEIRDFESMIRLVINMFRAKIERAREEEKQAIIKFLAKALGVFPDEQFDIIIAAIKLEIEQNKHREGKQ